DVGKVKIAESERPDAFRPCPFDDAPHPLIVDFIRAGPRQGNNPERKPSGYRLSVDQFHPHAVHGDAPEGFIVRRHQPYHFDLATLAQQVQRPGTVLARTPRQEGLRFHAGTPSATLNSSGVSRCAAGSPHGSGWTCGWRT